MAGLKLARNRLPFKLSDLLRKGHPVRINYENYDKTFGNDQLFYILVEDTRPQAPSTGELVEALKRIHWKLKNSPHIQNYISLKNAEYFTVQGDYIFMEPFIDRKGRITPSASIQLQSDFWQNTLISSDRRHLLINGNFKKSALEGSESRNAVGELIADLNEIEDSLPGRRLHILGVKLAEYHLLEDAIRNQKVITPILLLLLGALMYFLFRSMGILGLVIGLVEVRWIRTGPSPSGRSHHPP